MKSVGKFGLISLVWTCLMGVSEGGVARIWAADDGLKVERDDLKHPAQTKNPVWDGHKISLFGGRNEIIAFQLVVESDNQGIDGLLVELRELRSTSDKTAIRYLPPGSDPSHFLRRPIQLFSVNYMHVTEPTTANWIYRLGSPSAPPDPVGWKPVQLVPENAAAGRGGFPLRLKPLSNQAVWIEIYVAPDLAPGLYRGEVLVKADQFATAIPVELEVFDFKLSDQNTMHAMVYYQSGQPELYHGRNLDAVYHRFAHRQRIELVHAYSEATALAARGRFDGDDFTPALGYEGPGEGVGSQIIPASFYGPGPDFDHRTSAWKRSNAWMNFLAKHWPHALTFLYMPDEPRPSQFGRIRQIAENVHSNPGPGRTLPILITRAYTAELDGAVDIWNSGPQSYDIDKAEQERARGRDWWTYNGGRPQGGALVIEAPATDARATPWACFKHGIRVYFYWHGVHWRHNHQKVGHRIQNVWVNPITFDNRGQPGKPAHSQGVANGDGVLLYPGEDKLHPSQDRGIGGPCSTMRLANLRRGLQDHQYLTLARQKGLERLVQESLQAVVPRVFSDAAEVVGFAQSAQVFEEYRYKLARALADSEQ